MQRSRWSFLAWAMLCGTFATPAADAQEPMSEHGVREAVRRELAAKQTFRPGTQFVSDSTELSRFVRCRGTAATRRCVLTDSVPVVLLQVTMHRPDSALVWIGTYRMFDRRCPSGTRIDPPVVGVDNSERRTLIYGDGRWQEVGSRARIVC
jgi:hypothetical protein